MEPRAHHVLIGLFTLVFLAGALLFALWLGKASADREYAWYQVIFNRGVSGLSEGSPVKYSGIEVGDVAELSLDPEDPRNVRALIRVYSDVPIKEDTRAGLALTNITGSMSIELKGGTPDSQTLEGDRESPPSIPAEPSTFGTLMASSEQFFSRLDEVLAGVNTMVSPENARHLKRSLENIEAMTSSLEQLTARNEGALDQGMQGFAELAPVMRELRHTLRNLNSVISRFEDDPAGLLRGREPIEEFNP